MNVLCIGDVVGSVGCNFLRDRLPTLKKFKGIDLVICNGENSSDGNGITPSAADFLFKSGVDAITLGNHSFRRKEAYEMMDTIPFVVRPANFPEGTTPGNGMCTVDMGRTSVTIINVMGNAYMDNPLECPFKTVEKLLKKAESKIVIVDFHAEATGEKRAMGFFLDGKVSAVFGTHTHVQTADEQVLPNGTGYITDVGMTGTIDSILGVKKEIIIEKYITKMPARFDLADGNCKMNCVLFEIDVKTGKALSVERMEII